MRIAFLAERHCDEVPGLKGPRVVEVGCVVVDSRGPRASMRLWEWDSLVRPRALATGGESWAARLEALGIDAGALPFAPFDHDVALTLEHRLVELGVTAAAAWDLRTTFGRCGLGSPLWLRRWLTRVDLIGVGLLEYAMQVREPTRAALDEVISSTLPRQFPALDLRHAFAEAGAALAVFDAIKPPRYRREEPPAVAQLPPLPYSRVYPV